MIPLGVGLMIAAAVVLRRRGEWARGRFVALSLAGWYAVAVLGATMLPMRLSWGAGAGEPELFRILLIPFVTMQPSDFVLNVGMTLPLAAALHVVFGVRDRKRVVLTGFLLSLVIETTQLMMLLLHGSRWPDTNDLIANTLGAWLGWLAFQRLLTIPAVRRAAEPRQAEPAVRS